MSGRDEAGGPEVHKHRLWVLPRPFPPRGSVPPRQGHRGAARTTPLVVARLGDSSTASVQSPTFALN